MFTLLKRLTGNTIQGPSTLKGDPLIKINPRAKRILFRFDVREGRPVIVLPHQSHLKKIHHYSAPYHQWYDALTLPTPVVLENGAKILYKGVNLTLRLIAERLYSMPQITILDDVLRIIGRQEHFSAAIKDFFIEKTLVYAGERSAFYAEKLGVSLGDISVKDMKSMWGRCMRQRDLCYNWRLILTPPTIFDYVCAHEVSHCLHPNHGKDFWSTVATLCPHVNQSRRWLRLNSREIMGYPLHLV